MSGARTHILTAVALALQAALANPPAQAGAILEVAPVLLDIHAPRATGTISVKNDDVRPTTIQVRLFRWRQGEGEERYEPTEDVVASPPIANVAPGATLTIRVIRTAQTPVAGEESFRLVLDQLPESDRGGHAKVSMLLRQVLPVFFAQDDLSAPRVTWSVGRGARGYVLQAQTPAISACASRK